MSSLKTFGIAVFAAAFAAVGSAQGAVLSLNFVGGGPNGGASLAASDQAGDPGQSLLVPNWNNLSGASGAASDFVLSDGSGGIGSGYGASWNAAELWAIPSTTGGNNIGQSGGATGDGKQNPAMMKGCIGSTSTSVAATVTQCPYCIHSHTKTAAQHSATPEQIMEAIWVAAEMRAGGAHAHSILALETIAQHEAQHPAST